MRKTLIVGANSAIAQATARRFAAAGDALFLVSRNADKLASVAADLETRGASRVATHIMDADDLQAHAAMLETAIAALNGLDTVLIAYGTLPDQSACEAQPEQAVRAWHTNALSVIALLTRLANHFEQQRRGTLAVISSVAGDRGRKSNYVYGSAKAGLSCFLEGLRHRLHAADVRVLTIKPGMIDTPMTAAMPKGGLWSTPERVGRDIHAAIEQGRELCYTPFYWRYIMLVIRALPRWLFKRTDL